MVSLYQPQGTISLSLSLIFLSFRHIFYQGLSADGGGVHQEPGASQAPGGEERGGAHQGSSWSG